MPITWKQFERYWYIFSLVVIIGSLPFSKYGLSMGQMMLTGGWIVERIDKEKLRAYFYRRITWKVAAGALPFLLMLVFQSIVKGFRQFGNNKPALIFSSILLLHIAGLIFTTDFDYALKDLRTKFPLFLLPLLISTSEAFDRKSFFWLMTLFISTVLVRSFYNAWMIQSHRFVDLRDVSHNVSHIIFSLQLALCIFTLLWFTFRRSLFPGWKRALSLAAVAWFLVYIVLSQSVTGLSITLIMALMLAPVMIFNLQNRWIRTGLLLAIFVVTAGFIFAVKSIISDYYAIKPVDLTKLDKFTSRGNPYINNTYAGETENGTYRWIYIQWAEMRAAWNRRSSMPFDGPNKKGDTVSFTVIRYLTSKGWRKDGDAVERLYPQEITQIENGVANQVYSKKFAVRGKIYEFLRGLDRYRETGNPTGSSVMQRIEFWKASIGIIKDHWLTGVGTGDMNLAFRDQYEKMHTKLAPDQRWRSHNQYLSVIVGFGIFGLVWFLLALLYPPFLLRRLDDYFFLVFLVITFLSMTTGDTIESQTGVSFVAIFYSFLLFGRSEKISIFNKRNSDG